MRFTEIFPCPEMKNKTNFQFKGGEINGSPLSPSFVTWLGDRYYCRRCRFIWRLSGRAKCCLRLTAIQHASIIIIIPQTREEYASVTPSDLVDHIVRTASEPEYFSTVLSLGLSLCI